MGILNSAQREQLWTALLDAFDRDSLARMLSFRLDKRLDVIVGEDSLRDMVFELMDVAEMEGWTINLIAAAAESRPGNARLLAFNQQFGLAPGGLPPLSTATAAPGPGLPDNTGLEAMVKLSNRYLNAQPWLERLGEIIGQVCRVDIRGEGKGTGFLVGPDLVMTNYHVVRDAIEGNGVLPADLTVRFDFKISSDGRTLNPGTVFPLAGDGWLVDKSPFHPAELTGGMRAELPAADQLDYALLRTAARPGESAIGKAAVPPPGERARGWLKPKPGHPFAPGSPLFIVQHPRTEPLKLALETDAIVGLNANKTRVNYRTNTEEGSSGSPAFDQNWDLVALHHGWSGRQNQGIPFDAILALLRERELNLPC